MEQRKSRKAGGVRLKSSLARTNLLHHVDAISRALKNWNDTEALKLLRLHWPQIALAVRKARPANAISVLVPPAERSAGAHNGGAHFDDVIDRSANDDVHLSPAPLRTAS